MSFSSIFSPIEYQRFSCGCLHCTASMDIGTSLFRVRAVVFETSPPSLESGAARVHMHKYKIAVCISILLSLFAGASYAQSLGDVARRQRQSMPRARSLPTKRSPSRPTLPQFRPPTTTVPDNLPHPRFRPLKKRRRNNGSQRSRRKKRGLRRRKARWTN